MTPRERLEWMAFLNVRAEEMNKGKANSGPGKGAQLTDPSDIKAAMMAMSGLPRRPE